MIINKLIPFYLILLGGFLFAGSPIRDATEKYIISQFDVDVSINMHTLKLDTELKALVKNKVKQRFIEMNCIIGLSPIMTPPLLMP